MRFNFLLLTICFLLASCTDEVNMQETKPFPSLPYFSFKSIQDFEVTTNAVASMTDGELDSWEAEQSFTSYRTVLNHAIEKWESLVNEQDLQIYEKNKQSFINEYSDILNIYHDEISPKIDIRLYQAIVNREGIYIAGNNIHKVSGQNILITSLDNFSNLAKSDVSRMNGVDVVLYTGDQDGNNMRTDAVCSTMNTASFFYNRSNCRNDREVFISGNSYIILSKTQEGDYRQPRVQIKVWGKLRKGTWCNWASYETTLGYRNVSFVVPAWTVENNIATTMPFELILPDYFPDGDRTDLPWDQPIGSRVLNVPITAQPFMRLHGEGTSRGVNGNFAILDCQ